ncbi:MFS transporter [Nakamurella leprariae]|uniref:MFS transporter n=1 Tax=Nakamurella leprariae TaxID=2803911 RepID=A0A938YE77_9ACTN|nr:MFS transporter [Nakamurella leprariae]MBM9466559.1 MFS transporter [Nakamurella leprariae]
MRSLPIASVRDINTLVDTEDIRTRRHKILLLLALGGIAFEAAFLAVLSAGTSPMTEQLGLSANQVGSVSAYGYVATLIAALTCGFLADRLGRVRLMVLAKLVAVVGLVLMATAPDFLMLVVGRCLAGAAYGIDLGVAMAYLAEFLPKVRRHLLNFWQAQWYISSVVALVIVLGLYQVDVGLDVWRWSLAVAGGFALLITIAQIALMPESPRWLAQRGDLPRLRRSLNQVYEIDPVFPTSGRLTAEPTRPDASRWSELFQQKYRRRTLLANGVTMMQALQYYAVAYYLPVIALTLFGEGFGEAIVGSIVFNVFGIIGGVASIWVARRLGAHHSALYGFAAVAATILVLGVFFDSMPVALMFLVPALFICFHSAGPGVSGLTMAAMAYPSDLRGRGGQVATVSQSIGGIVGLYLFPVLVDEWGLATTITVFTVVPLLGVAICLAIRWEPFTEGEGDPEDAVALEAAAELHDRLDDQGPAGGTPVRRVEEPTA